MRRPWKISDKGMRWFPFFSKAEYKYGLPPRMLARVAYQESRYNPDAYNPRSGARGMMQIIPRFHPGVNVEDSDPQDDIFYAARYLRENYNRFGDWKMALAAYNWGPGNVRKAIDEHGVFWLAHAPVETRNYVTDISHDIGLSA